MATAAPTDNPTADGAVPAANTAAAPTATQLRSHWQFAWSRLKRDRFALAGGIVVVVLFVITATVPYLPLHNPLTQFPDGLTGQFAVPIPPGESRFVLGTDPLGRDFLSRLVWGGRISLTVALLANVTSISLAILVGAIAGYLGGWLDTLIMRFVDLFLSFPALLLQIALATVLPPSLLTVILVITLFGWVFPARIFRGQVLSLREQNFVEAARAVGASELRIFFTHILPQLWPTVIVFSTLRVPAAILTEAGLSFVGLGVRPPAPSWGNLILEGFRYFRSAPWLIIFPGLAIMLAVMSFNLLGDGLRDALDPREQQAGQMQGQR
jgi:ABC-type dipeptide/oligopeptide/nickel transport system permease subunit